MTTKIKIETSGRTDLDDFFKMGMGDTSHYPYLVFEYDNKTNTVFVRQESSREAVLKYPDDTKVMKQWEGKWRSDFFQFTVGQMRGEKAKEESTVEVDLRKATIINVEVKSSGRVAYIRTNPYVDTGLLSYDEILDLAIKVNPDAVRIVMGKTTSRQGETYTAKEWVIKKEGERIAEKEREKIHAAYQEKNRKEMVSLASCLMSKAKTLWLNMDRTLRDFKETELRNAKEIEVSVSVGGKEIEIICRDGLKAAWFKKEDALEMLGGVLLLFHDKTDISYNYCYLGSIETIIDMQEPTKRGVKQ